ncbi:hypothetical protein PBOI14_37350 [Pseudomonas sp. Boi14]|nr:hypothetical protein PBOI14_37350 [Pseudomonas sp. Boi14]
MIFGLIPLIDGLMGEDASNPPESAVPDLEKQPYYRFIVYSCAVLSVLSLVVTAWMAISGVDWIIAGGLLQLSEQLHLQGSLASFAAFLTERAQLHGSIGWFTYLGMAMSTGAATGIAINIAHELGHKNRGMAKFLAKLALASTFYGHFFVEHNRGHHVRVATPEDPASSRLGESFWSFLPRTVWFSLSSAWHLESQRLEKLGLPTLHWKNGVLSAWLYSVVLWGVLIAWLGAAVIPFLVIQGSTASLCWRWSTTSSTTVCCARNSPTAVMNAARRATPGTATGSSPTSSCSSCSATPTTTPTRPVRIRPCVTSTSRHSCPMATPP